VGGRSCTIGYGEETHGGDKYSGGEKVADNDSLSIVCPAVVDSARSTSFVGVFIDGG
jgi:hypothetical protein